MAVERMDASARDLDNILATESITLWYNGEQTVKNGCEVALVKNSDCKLPTTFILADHHH